MSEYKPKDAGELRERPEVLRLKADGSEVKWESIRKTWAAAELSTRKNVWSVYGIGATGVTFIMRRQSITLQDALRWRGHHCFITAITPYGRGHIKVEAALVVTSVCEYKYSGLTFPGIVTEVYHRHEQLEPYAINTIRHALITPKCVVLSPGKLVEVGGQAWPIRTALTLDPGKNEYIIEREVDL